MTRILYVDDESDISAVATMSLELDPNFEVRSCISGHDAVPLAAQWQPDLIMLDVMMPGIDGPGTLAALRAQAETAHIPILFITARTQAQEVEALKALGARGVIAKPFDPMALAETVRGYLNA